MLANSGYGTRKEIKKLIREGSVRVDGVPADDGGMQVDPEKSVIEAGGAVLRYRKYVYVMMNKPGGVVSATFDNKYRTVVDILPDRFKAFGLFPIGRLDIDTEGLLILTNDGQLAHELLSPRKHVKKRYYAVVEGEVADDAVGTFKEGVTLDDGYKTLPSDLYIVKRGDFSEVELDIYEGKFHQVKRMFEAVGKRVKYLKRIEMGRVRLDEGLAPGACRELEDTEIEELRMSVKKM